MKKFSIVLIAAVMAIGFSAFTTHSNKVDADGLQTFIWHKYDADGTAELDPVVSYEGTASGARSEFGCPTEGAVNCARAYNSLGNPLNIYITKPMP